MLNFNEAADVAAHDEVYRWLTGTATSALLLLGREARGQTGQSFHDKAQGVLLMWTKLTGSSARDDDMARLKELVDSIPNPN